MKYKVGDYLAGPHTVLLRIIVAMDEGYELYAATSCKHPTELRWFSRHQLDHEDMKLAQLDPDEFLNAEVGDHVLCGQDEYRQVLAKSGRGLLLSQSADELAKAIVGTLEQAKQDGAPVPDEMLSHMKRHASNRVASMAADQWWDMETMALMNWKLVRE